MPERLLVVGPAWVGDMVMSQSLFIRLAEHRPDLQLDVLAPGWSMPLLERMPQVNQVIEMPLGHGEFGFLERRRLGRSLRARDYRQAIVLPRSFKSALVPYFAGVPRRTGYRGEMRFGLLNDMRALDKRRLTQTVQRYVSLGLPADAVQPPDVPEPCLRVDPDNQRRLISALSLNPDRPIVAIMPGAEYGPAKCWPLEHFASVARSLVERECLVWIMGSERDRAAGETIIKQAGVTARDGRGSGELRNLCGQTTLTDAVDLLALADFALSNDSGLMHVAAAVGCYVVAVYGSSTPDYTPPLNANSTVHYLRLDCSPCFERDCPLGHLNCLRGISPDSVLQSLDHAVREPRVQPHA
ncbi:MAG: lipopolysaccharide heptosyltransferase II [Gammaproteobacteria bacterium]